MSDHSVATKQGAHGDAALEPGQATTAADPAAAHLQHLGAGRLTAVQVAERLRLLPQGFRGAALAELARTRGNSFVQQVIAAMASPTVDPAALMQTEMKNDHAPAPPRPTHGAESLTLALDRIHGYGQRKRDFLRTMNSAGNKALAEFKARSSAEFNKSGSAAFELFQVALALSFPLGAKALKEIASATGSATRIAQLTSVATTMERVHTAKGAIAEVRKPGAAQAETSAARSKATFELNSLEALNQAEISDLAATQADERALKDFAANLAENPEVDVNAQVAALIAQLPEIPKEESLLDGYKSFTAAFELQLYLAYYFASGRCNWEVVTDEFGGQKEVFGNVPPAVLDRVFKDLDGSAAAVDALKRSQGKPRQRHTQWQGRMQ